MVNTSKQIYEKQKLGIEFLRKTTSKYKKIYFAINKLKQYLFSIGSDVNIKTYTTEIEQKVIITFDTVVYVFIAFNDQLSMVRYQYGTISDNIIIQQHEYCFIKHILDCINNELNNDYGK